MEAQRRDPAGWVGYRTEADLRVLFARRVEQAGLETFPAPGAAIGPAYAVVLRQPAARLELTKSVPTLGPKQREEIRQEYRLAAEALKRQQQYDPTDAALAYSIAELYAQADDQKVLAAAAQHALDLHNRTESRPQSLSDQQRSQLERWLGKEESS
jgi:hypothetical protein